MTKNSQLLDFNGAQGRNRTGTGVAPQRILRAKCYVLLSRFSKRYIGQRGTKTTQNDYATAEKRRSDNLIFCLFSCNLERDIKHKKAQGGVMRMITCLACFISLNAYAGDVSIQFNGRSYHIEDGYNQSNNGAGIEYETDHGSYFRKLTAGSLRNSMNDTSLYAGAVWAWRLKGDLLDLDAGVYTGLMTYPSYKDGNAFPVLLPTISIGTTTGGVNFIWIPDRGKELPGAMFVQARVKLF